MKLIEEIYKSFDAEGERIGQAGHYPQLTWALQLLSSLRILSEIVK
jgi:hypothetical protein